MSYEYQEGRDAYHDGYSIWSNPYDMDEAWHDYDEWETGYTDAQQEAEEE